MNMQRDSQRGTALITALFLIVVVAALATVAARIGTDQQHATTLAIQHERAHLAAVSGLEFGIFRATTGAAPCNAALGATGTQTFNFAATAQTLSGFIVTVSCIRTQHTISGTNYFRYQLNATAHLGTYGTPDYVQSSASKAVSNILPGMW